MNMRPIDRSADFLKQVEQELSFLLSDGPFKVLKKEASQRGGGYEAVVLESADLRVMVERERGEVSFDFASPANPDDWHGDWFVHQLIVGRPPSQPLTLKSLAEFTRQFLPNLVEVFSPPRLAATAKQLRECEAKWTSRLLRGETEDGV